MTALHDVALLRLVAQRIAGPGFATATDAVRWMTGVQAQDHNGALTSVALRTSSRSRQPIEDALDAGEVVKSWPMRGTLHLVVAEDLPWMLDLLAPRVVAGAAARRAQLNLDMPDLEHARELAVEALVGGGQLMREELLAVWDQAGLTTAGQRGYHMLWHLAQTGTLCFGPLRNGQQQIVLVDEWVPRPRRLERQEALGELALRYLRSHGPATVKDLMRWTHLVADDARTGLALARPQLASLDVDGVEHFMDPGTPELLESYRRDARGVVLLPGFDELVLGYQDRSCVLAPELADRIVPGGNGIFKATVVSDGEIVGTWKHAGRGAKRTMEATPFTSFPDDVAEAISEAYAALP
ncbi:MAG TPA: winged helix DNA-binding domain-containing protein [Acidimicrobiales bacterium]|nr:winged helix DNA-binding domain-containing protein [Acidimicrobiales bacterium]